MIIIQSSLPNSYATFYEPLMVNYSSSSHLMIFHDLIQGSLPLIWLWFHYFIIRTEEEEEEDEKEE